MLIYDISDKTMEVNTIIINMSNAEYKAREKRFFE